MRVSMVPMSETMRCTVDQYPRVKARTLRFTSGAPRSAKVIGDGSRMLFLRSGGPEDLTNALWMGWFDADGGHHESVLADSHELLGGDEEIPAEEKARRERAREGGAGIVAYAVDEAGKRVAFTLSGRLFVADVPQTACDCAPNATVRELATERRPVLNPCISPDGRRVMYTTGAALVVVEVSTGAVEVVARAEGESQRIGLAEFVAGEEMNRYEGFWWGPDCQSAIVETFDTADEPLWTIADPSQPFSYPQNADETHRRPAVGARRYPRALTHNAQTRLTLLRLPYGGAVSAVDIAWDHDAFEYLARVDWQRGHDPLLLVQNRRQTRDQVLAVNPTDGTTRALAEHANDQWIDIIDGTPAFAPDGRLVCALADMAVDTNRLTVDGEPFTPAGWNVREVLHVDGDGVLAVVQRNPLRDEAGVPQEWAARADEHDARCFDVARLGFDGSVAAVSKDPGVWSAVCGGDGGRGLVLSGRTLEDNAATMIHTATVCGRSCSAVVASNAAVPGFALTTRLVTLPGEHALLAAITVPSVDSPYAEADSLPVLMRPYGGPGFQQAVASAAYHWDSQWWADQGFIVVTADGRGTTGRGPAWDRAIFERMKDVTLADQVEAVRGLRALADAAPDGLPKPDFDRVAIIGWSYGGFLSALVVLDAPEVFKAACAGAPPTDWTLYDTHYTERYLGLDPSVYERNSIIADAPKLTRPLMLIHGFADDNVTIAHSLRLSSALTAAGRAHTFLPLVNITHMTNDETVAENLLILQRDFLRANL